MAKVILATLLAVFLLCPVVTVQADIMYATEVTNIYRGTVPGNFVGYYGGTFPGSYPVSLTEAQAKAAVLGVPDSKFLSIPGSASTADVDAYVEVRFASNFTSASDLYITELGANQESVRVFLWLVGGGNYQFNITRDGTDTVIVDLDSYSGTFEKVGLMGRDQLGASWGFDLDAVGVTAVPEPISLVLLGLAIAGLAGMRKTRN